MNALEMRYYTLEEIGTAVGRNPHGGQFKRDVERDLKLWGYEWQWQPRKGVTITGRKMTPQLRLKELFFDQLNLNTPLSIADFACFLSAFFVIEGSRKERFGKPQKTSTALHPEPVDPDSAEYKEFCSVRTATLEALEAEGSPPDRRWNEMIHRLIGQYGHYYYCPEICLNAFGEHAQEITELVSTILEARGKSE